MRRVDYRETLVTYLRSESWDDLAKTLGISKQGAKARIDVLKKAGVNVPKMTRRGGGISRLDVAQYNSIIKKHQAEEARA